MKAYELLLFTDPSIDEESRLAALARIDSVIKAANGAVENVEEWGKRKLAYEIEGLAEGNYVLINFQMEPDQIAELDRVLRISDVVVRHMIVRRDDRA